LLFSSLTCHLD